MPNPKYDGAAGQIAPGEEAEDVNLGASIPPMSAAPPYHMGESLNQEFLAGAAAGRMYGQVQD